MIVDVRTEGVIGAATAVHRTLGAGLLESAYAACLAVELARREIPFRREVCVPIMYRGHLVDASYRLDFLALESIVVEVKSVEAINPVHVAQALTYMRLGAYPAGLLLNFNVPVLREGITRLSL
ncbi:MAG: GxxExxY protein [Gemmatimonadetes bacterium]|nr:GxxExxY protein [Gemmatimonadota bacterium]